MALVTLTEAKTFAGITNADPVRDASLQTMLDEVINAVKNHCVNGSLEATTYTIVLDAPPSNVLILPYAPVIYAPTESPAIDFQLYFNSGANGDPSAFTSDNLLTIFEDYVLQVGRTDTRTFPSGIVRSLRGPWLLNRERPTYSLATKLVPCYGAIKVVYKAGYETVPASLKGAINLAARKLFHARKFGVPLTSESLNGYSYSAQGSATAEGIIQGDPTIRSMLRAFCRPQVGGYY